MLCTSLRFAHRSGFIFNIVDRLQQLISSNRGWSFEPKKVEPFPLILNPILPLPLQLQIV